MNKKEFKDIWKNIKVINREMGELSTDIVWVRESLVRLENSHKNFARKAEVRIVLTILSILTVLIGYSLTTGN